jgi:arginyl-tRNA synthetase
MNLLEALRARFATAAPAGSDPVAFAAAVRPSTDPKFGDYQANGAMALAKALRVNPRTVAQDVADRVDLEPLAGTPQIAGPGFLNVQLREIWMAEALQALSSDERLGLGPPGQAQSVVIDYSSPNVAKPMHVGHIRSTVIGDSLARILSALGHTVVRDNHLGDWGAQFGMILYGWKQHRDEHAYLADPVGHLASLYRRVQAQIAAPNALRESLGDALALAKKGKHAEAVLRFSAGTPKPLKVVDDPGFARAERAFEAAVTELETAESAARRVEEAARIETVMLHAGDLENRALWDQFMPHCLAALEGVYRRLGVRFDVELGESFYDPMLTDVVKDLEAKNLAVESEGAVVVHSDRTKVPFIVRKRDGAFNYATTDLATIRYRVETWSPDQILYVVDHRQGDHFKALFDVARRWGYTHPQYEHVAFGTILGPDRKPFKTRAGDTVGLESLLDEAVARARKVIDANSPELDETERARVSEIVGLGALKYADLSQNRLSDYVFDWDKMLALNGNTATYIQYAYARIRSIFRKGEVDPDAFRATRPPIELGHPAERALGLLILRWPETLSLAAAELKPNILTDYLFTLANAFSTFFENCPVLKAETGTLRTSRLALADLTARVLERGLALLGISVVERM